MLRKRESYETLREDFRWRIPKRYNIGLDVCDRHACAANKLALIHLEENGVERRFSFADIKHLSNRFANVLRAHGAVKGDRIGILLPQAPETAIAHVSGFKLGLITVPLFTLFATDALAYRLSNSSARAVVTDCTGAEKIEAIRDRLPALERVYTIDGPGASGAEDFHSLCRQASDVFTPVETAAEDPAVLIYTSGTTGDPKGALHAHRVLLGHLPGVELSHTFLPQRGDRFWTPADWAWIGGLFDVLLPAWHHGIPVVAHRAKKFDPEAAFRLLETQSIRNAFLPPTALKLMRLARGGASQALKLRSVASGGESLGSDLLDWGHSVFGLTIDEFYGQTECNVVASSCAYLYAGRPGAIGRAVPGHNIQIIDCNGKEMARGTIGSIAVRRPDPVMFLGYWNNEQATVEKFVGDFLITGDLGHMDEDDYIWFVGRYDDVITSGGYRIGPSEIEECLIRHPAVVMAAVVGIPDPIRTEVVKAFVVLKRGIEPSETLAFEIQNFVKVRLAAHEYPRQLAFVDTLPMTMTGKIIRKALRQIGS
jgi:acetyl-CoA synthetase